MEVQEVWLEVLEILNLPLLDIDEYASCEYDAVERLQAGLQTNLHSN